jgi:hypothetical protein
MSSPHSVPSDLPGTWSRPMFGVGTVRMAAREDRFTVKDGSFRRTRRSSEAWMKSLTAAILSSMAAFAPQQASAVTTFGSSSCGVWVRERAEGKQSSQASRFWLAGYLSGLAVGRDRDVIGETDADSVFLWMDKYCKANPLANVGTGADELFDELAVRSLDAGKKRPTKP